MFLFVNNKINLDVDVVLRLNFYCDEVYIRSININNYSIISQIKNIMSLCHCSK